MCRSPASGIVAAGPGRERPAARRTSRNRTAGANLCRRLTGAARAVYREAPRPLAKTSALTDLSPRPHPQSAMVPASLLASAPGRDCTPRPAICFRPAQTSGRLPYNGRRPPHLIIRQRVGAVIVCGGLLSVNLPSTSRQLRSSPRGIFTAGPRRPGMRVDGFKVRGHRGRVASKQSELAEKSDRRSGPGWNTNRPRRLYLHERTRATPRRPGQPASRRLFIEVGVPCLTSTPNSSMR
jgi:hypothetical protein